MTALVSAAVLGLAVGLPYYALPFFYDYFEQDTGWPRAAILLGLPLGTLMTLVVGPLLTRRVALKTGIVTGSLICGASIVAMAWCRGPVVYYWLCWIVYMTAWMFAGPLAHQVLLARAMPERRAAAIATAFFGISAVGAVAVPFIARPLTAAFGYRTALMAVGGLMLAAAPIAALGLPAVERENEREKAAWRADGAFWRLASGSALTAAGIAGILQHLKFILRERAYPQQQELDAVFGWTMLLLLTGSSAGRFVFAWMANRMPARRVLTLSASLMALALPMLWVMPPYAFGLLFGLGMSSDSLLTALLAAERYGSAEMARPLAVIVPVTAVAQTWFPSALTPLWSATGSYDAPIALTAVCILGGRTLLARAAS